MLDEWRQACLAQVDPSFRVLAAQLDERATTEAEYQEAVINLGFYDLFVSKEPIKTTLLYQLLETVADECGFCDKTHWCTRLLRAVLRQQHKGRRKVRVSDGIGITLHSKRVWNLVSVMPLPLIRIFCRHSGLAQHLATEQLHNHWSMMAPRSAIFALVDQMCEESSRFRLTALPSLLRGAYLLRDPESSGLRWIRGWAWWLLCARIDGDPLAVSPSLLCVLGNPDLRWIVAEYVL